MKKRIMIIMGAVGLCLFFSACQKADDKAEREDFFLEESILTEEDKETEEIEETEAVEIEEDQKEEKQPQILAVHLCGAVKEPGVYQVQEDTRIFQVLEMAGGFLPDADQDYLNLALTVEDGMQLRVPTKEETKGYSYPVVETGASTQEASGKIDLNKADEAQLCTLPGIGESRAKSIIQYRREQGDFQKPEDIMKVSGIKEAAYEKIKDYIVVSK